MDLSKTVEILNTNSACSDKSDVSDYAFHIAVNKDVFPLYISNIELFISLSIAAIVLSVAYGERVLGRDGKMQLGRLTIASWFFLLSTIAAGAYYMFAAIKHMEARYNCSEFLTFGELPGTVYGIVVVLFVLGIFTLFVSVIRQTWKI